MRRDMKGKTAAFLAAALLCLTGVGEAAEAEGARITINLASRILTFWRDGRKVTMYPIAAGRPDTQTPVGRFAVVEKEMDPEWIDPKDVKKKIPPGEENPLGRRWMRFYKTYGIHGTNEPGSIGGYVSDGCVRLREENVEELFAMTALGTPVEIAYERLVVERLADGRVAYYIYPDGYEREALDAEKVKKALTRFGVGVFADAKEIAVKIAAADGRPTIFPRVYRMEADGLWISGAAAALEDGLYLPVSPLSALTKREVVSDWNTGLLSTAGGEAPGVRVHGVLYVALADARTLFGLTGALEADGVLRLYRLPDAEEAANGRHRGVMEAYGRGDAAENGRRP